MVLFDRWSEIRGYFSHTLLPTDCKMVVLFDRWSYFPGGLIYRFQCTLNLKNVSLKWLGHSNPHFWWLDKLAHKVSPSKHQTTHKICPLKWFYIILSIFDDRVILVIYRLSIHMQWCFHNWSNRPFITVSLYNILTSINQLICRELLSWSRQLLALSPLVMNWTLSLSLKLSR